MTFSEVTHADAGFRGRQELLLDPTTYEYRGSRFTALEDGSFDDGRAVTEGEVWYNDPDCSASGAPPTGSTLRVSSGEDEPMPSNRAIPVRQHGRPPLGLAPCLLRGTRGGV